MDITTIAAETAQEIRAFTGTLHMRSNERIAEPIQQALTTATAEAQTRIAELETELVSAREQRESLQKWIDDLHDFVAFTMADSGVEVDYSKGETIIKSVIDGVRKEGREHFAERIADLERQLAEALGERDQAQHEVRACHTLYDEILVACGFDPKKGHPGVTFATRDVIAERNTLREQLAEAKRERDQMERNWRGVERHRDIDLECYNEMRNVVLEAGYNFGLALTADYLRAIVGELKQLRADLAAARERIGVLESGIKEAIGCFDAAEAEGLIDVLTQRDGDRMMDLFERRIGFAYGNLTAALQRDTEAAKGE